MKLQSKLALFNAVSKAAIVLVFVLLMPMAINYVALQNTDRQLQHKKEQVMAMIEQSSISTFIEEGSETGYGSYNLLKEEFISLEAIAPGEVADGIENSRRKVDDEIVNYRVLSYNFEEGAQHYLLEVGRSLSTIEEIAGMLRRFGFFTLLAIVLLTVTTDIAFTKYLLSPLQHINSKLRKTHDPSSFSVQKISTTTDEFKYLDDSIHDLMQRIEIAFVKEREFISNVSHELLTPISILQSKLENMMVSEELGEENTLRLIESQKTLARLKNIIRTLLLISKIENEQYLRQETVTLSALLQEVVGEIEDRLLVKNICLETDLEADFCFSGCNQSLLHTLIFNLLNNAIKYNRSNGNILVKGYLTTAGYVLEIEDTGVGISSENLPHIFSRFKRFHHSDGDSFGLGLPIVKTIADYHGITISVSSQPKQGSSFKLLFPHKITSEQRQLAKAFS